MEITLGILPFESRKHLHPFPREEPQQVGPGGRLLLRGCGVRGRPDHPVDVHVGPGEPRHRDVAAGGLRQHHPGLQQQGSAVRQRLHGTGPPAAAGRRFLRAHRDGRDGKQQGRRPGPPSER